MGSAVGQALIFLGIIVVLIGVVIWLAPSIPFLGKLPGDFSFSIGNVHVFFPLATSIVLSIVLTLLLNFIFGRH